MDLSKLKIQHRLPKEILTQLDGLCDSLAYSPKHVSLFSGCGGLDYPFHRAGFANVWANDFDESASETFARNIADSIRCGSIEDFNLEDVAETIGDDVDIVSGGFPCQDFSVIWKRPGLNSIRGNLYTYLLTTVRLLRPKVFVVENVRGLLSANNQKAVERIISDFQKIEPGYLIKPKLYKFVEYGVPQFRERLIIVGVRKDTAFNFKHPAPTHSENGNDGLLPFVTAGEALAGVEEVPHNQELMNIKPRTVEILKRISAGGNFTDIEPDDEYYVKGMISHVYRRIHPDKPATTLIAGGGGGTWGYHYPEPRALTNRERARLQTFPDDYIFCGTMTQIRRQIGNAVPPSGIVPIVLSLMPLFSGDYEREDLFEQSRRLDKLSVKERIIISEEESIGGKTSPISIPFPNM